jgi:predicted  nucleic acid-binding Zn-ribbon protein
MLSPQAQAQLNSILANCNSAHEDIDKQRAKLETQIQNIEAPTPPRPLTADEFAQIDKLNAADDALSDADDGISTDAVEALEDSQAAQSLADNITTVNQGLKTKLAAVNKTAQDIQQAADFIQKLDGIARGLIKLAGLLA